MQLAAKINKWGVCGILLSLCVVAVPFHHPFCILWPLLHASGAVCNAVAAFRGSKYWFIFAAISALLAAQATLAIMVEC
jgi:hypothetical protein